MYRILLLLALSCTAAQAQVYRCGNSYSGSPCAGARLVETSPAVSNRSAPSGTTIHLCQSYSGGQFWSSRACVHSNALLERSESVPSHMSFAQQVEIAQTQIRQSQSSAIRTVTIHNDAPADDRRGQCQALEARITQLDSAGRAGGTAQHMDWVRAQRHQARDEQFRLRC
jgi:hypothetical protein